MSTKKILVLAPVLPEPSDIESIAKSLSFLNKEYDIDFIDSLTIMQDVSNEEYYQLWENELQKRVINYDAFLGFSFGGVILQQCFSIFSTLNKPIILFSTPTRANDSLTQKLGNVLSLCKENKLNDALKILYDDVYYPDKAPTLSRENSNSDLAAKRLIFGLSRVLATDSTKIAQQSSVKHLHLIGEYSCLVNEHNVIAPKSGRLVIVPGASMRVLENNLPYCKKLIMETLISETE